MRRSAPFPLSFNAAASALACSLALLSAGASAAPVKIGVLETLSGPQASSGQAYRTAVRFAIDQINAAGGWNGEPVQLLEYDNQGGPAGAADKLKAAAADGVQLIVQGASSAIGGQITEDIRKDVEKLLKEKSKSFKQSVIHRESVAAAPLAKWVAAVIKYSEVFWARIKKYK